MRIDSRMAQRDPAVARARLFGAMAAGVLLMAGCGMITVVSDEHPSDYALCVEKRESGGVKPEAAALECTGLARHTNSEVI